MIRYAPKDIASVAVRCWGSNSNSLLHLSDSGNSIYSYEKLGTRYILRLTDPLYRLREHLVAEADFLDHLRNSGVPVSHAIRSLSGQWVEEVRTDAERFFASSFSFAPGVSVERGSAHWTRTFFIEWGRLLGQIHRASEGYNPTIPERRWKWDEEGWITNALFLIPEEDTRSRSEFVDVMKAVRSFGEAFNAFGLIHADFAPQNFRFVPEKSEITAFDFGNCCYHLYLSDLAVSLSTLRREEDREQLRDWLLTGYSSIRQLKPGFEEEFGWLIRLRVVYVYLSRLFKFGKNPTEQERQTLTQLRSRVHERKGW